MKKDIADVFYIIGMVGICYGVSMWSLPAAIILAGVFCIVISYLIYRARTKGGAK